jgi:hypothetical protein
MAATGSFFHNSAHTVNIAATNAYAVARSHNITNLGGGTMGGTGLTAPKRSYVLRTLYIKLDTLAGLSASPVLTVRLTRDANGNDTVVGDTTASISVGVTTATEGAITIAIDFVYSHNDGSGVTLDNLHCFWKLDQGTANVRRIELTTQE